MNREDLKRTYLEKLAREDLKRTYLEKLAPYIRHSPLENKVVGDILNEAYNQIYRIGYQHGHEEGYRTGYQHGHEEGVIDPDFR